MAPTYYTLKQLAAAAGYSVRGLRNHVSKPDRPTTLTPVEPEKLPGIHGLRFTRAAAEKWLNLYSPGSKLPH